MQLVVDLLSYKQKHKSWLCCQPSVGGVTVSIVAFQAVDPGSTPGQRIFCLQTVSGKSFFKQTLFLCMNKPSELYKQFFAPLDQLEKAWQFTTEFHKIKKNVIWNYTNYKQYTSMYIW